MCIYRGKTFLRKGSPLTEAVPSASLCSASPRTAGSHPEPLFQRLSAPNFQPDMALTHSITKTVVLQECHVRLKI